MAQSDRQPEAVARAGLFMDSKNTTEEDYGPVTPGIYGPEGTSTSPQSGYLGRGPAVAGVLNTDRDAQRDATQKQSTNDSSPEEVLRRLSLQGQRTKPKEVDPRESHPSLNLSGSVISASFSTLR